MCVVCESVYIWIFGESSKFLIFTCFFRLLFLGLGVFFGIFWNIWVGVCLLSLIPELGSGEVGLLAPVWA